MLPGKKYRPEDLVRIAWRRKWLIALCFVVVAAAMLVLSAVVPNRYRSQTVILVIPQRVPESYVRSSISSRIEDRLQTMREKILSRSRLERIIYEFSLYPYERRFNPMQDVVEQMQRDIEVQIVKGDAFKVAFVYKDPRTTMQVAERLGSLFVEETLLDRQSLAVETSKFLQTEVEQARRQLNEHERRLTEYQRKFAGELPSDRGSNLQVLHNLEMQVQALTEAMNRDRERRALFERELADLNEEITSRAAVQVGSQEDPAGASTLNAAMRLEIARAQLRALEVRYKPDWPDIGRLKRLITDLEKAAEAEALATPLSPSAASRGMTPEEQARQKKIKELQASIADLDIQLGTKQTEERNIRARIADGQGRLAATPIRDAEMTALNRDYETLKKNYENLLTKQEDSKLSANLEFQQLGDSFQVLDHARLPERPFSPNRLFLNLIGIVGGLALGGAAAFLLEYRDSSLRSEEEVTRCLALPALALVPLVRTPAERRRAKRRRTVLSMAAAGVFVVLVAASAIAWKIGWLEGFLAW